MNKEQLKQYYPLVYELLAKEHDDILDYIKEEFYNYGTEEDIRKYTKFEMMNEIRRFLGDEEMTIPEIKNEIDEED